VFLHHVFALRCTPACACGWLQVRLGPEDQRRYDGWQTVDKYAVQAEFIEFLAWEQYHVRPARAVCVCVCKHVEAGYLQWQRIVFVCPVPHVPVVAHCPCSEPCVCAQT
jgi:hypothetical protein